MGYFDSASFTVTAHNPEYLDTFQFVPIDTEVKQMTGPYKWQKAAFDLCKDAKFAAIQAFCGSGKSVLQVQLSIHDIVSSDYKQKQLIAVPQEHIHRGFVGQGNVDYLRVKQGRREYQWSIQPDHNFCDGQDRLEGLKRWLLTPSSQLSKCFRGSVIGGLNAVCSHQALTMLWKKLSPVQKKKAIKNLTLRIDEAHHIKHVFLEDEMVEMDYDQSYDATELGRICTYVINKGGRNSKIHTTTATMMRGDRKTILSNGVRNKFVEYNLDWFSHFKSLGIRDFVLQYQEYEKDPIDLVLTTIAKELDQKHIIVVPPINGRWRNNNDTNLKNLKAGLTKLYPEDRILDLVDQLKQKVNKKRLLAEPKQKNDDTPSQFDVIIMCKLGREGTDWCPCSRLHNTACEDSITLAVQTIGRAFRRFEGKEDIKIFHYMPCTRLESSKLRDALCDRSNALLVCMQFDEFVRPIIVEEAPGRKGASRNGSITLVDVLGDQYHSVLLKMFVEYEILQEKTPEMIASMLDQVLNDFGIEGNLENVKNALMARLTRTASFDPRFKGINSAYIRKNGFDKVVPSLRESIYFPGHAAGYTAGYTADDLAKLRQALVGNIDFYIYDSCKILIQTLGIKTLAEHYHWKHTGKIPDRGQDKKKIDALFRRLEKGQVA